MAGCRRAHHKSRHSCMECKRRRIKCDEVKPACHHCVRNSNHCIYLQVPTPSPLSEEYRCNPTFDGASYTSLSPSSTGHSIFDRNKGNPISGVFITGHERLNLELLHFWTTETCFTMCSLPKRQQLMHSVIPRIALSHEFLLQGILALSALHLAHVEPCRKDSLCSTASRYYQAALTSYRSEMTKLTPQNCDACFAFSGLLLVYASAVSEGTCDLFFADRRIKTEDVGLLAETTQWTQRGPLNQMLIPWDDENYEEPPRIPSLDINEKFKALRTLWDSPSYSMAEIEELNSALTMLETAYEWVTRYRDRVAVIGVTLSWPVQLSPSVVELVKKRQPEVLVLLAHYSLLLNIIDEFWWIRGMSEHLLQTIQTYLGPEWEAWIRWPLEELELRASNLESG